MTTPNAIALISPSRRLFLFETTAATLSGAAIALLAGAPRLAQAASHAEGQALTDIQILNAALAAEREAIAAYQVGAESGLLKKNVLKTAVQFQGHHKAHADVLAGTIKKLGGESAEAPAKYDFPVHQLKSQKDVLAFAAKLERGAVTAYAGAIPKFENRDLSQASASILSDEAMHWAVLRQVSGLDPVPGAFFA
jgi:bacterioferritin (cytochrome b1)